MEELESNGRDTGSLPSENGKETISPYPKRRTLGILYSQLFIAALIASSSGTIPIRRGAMTRWKMMTLPTP